MGKKKRDSYDLNETELEVDNILQIDKNILDDEWLGQARLYFQWAVQLEDARDEFEETKAAFDVVKSDLDLAIRTNPDAYDLPKVTDKSVAAALIIQPEYKDAQQEVFIARHRVGILQAAVTSLDHRKKALEKLVDLHGQKYFASPRVSEHSREAVENIEKRSARIKVKIKGKSRKVHH